jgi:DNA polymerase-3 subunit gamma/tau
MATPDSNTSGYLVIARKYRPQLFEEIVGQESTARTLRNAIQQKRIAHAYLFAGVRGVGKTTTARILAKALNCQEGPTVTPCNQCDSCREIAAGNALDVLEIDAASNRGIDEIRELRENVKYQPARDRYKVFIIDEVHMLTTEAFNALLKTLEEPPEHAVFILATTELHKVPSTILSRCQHFNFRAIDRQAILGKLREIAASENVEISENSLNDIVVASEGSMRDAQSILDQVISFCGKVVGETEVREMLGVVPHQILIEFTRAFSAGDSREVLLLVDHLFQSGRNLQQFVRDLLGHFRHLLLLKIVGPDSQLVPLAGEQLRQMAEAAEGFSEEDLLRYFNILVRTEGELRWSSQARFHLEMGMLKIVQAKRLMSIEKVLAGLQGLAASTAGDPEENFPLPKPSNLPELPRRESPPNSTFSILPAGGGAAQDRSASLAGLKNAIAKQSPMIGALLDHAQSLKIAEKEWQLDFGANQHFYVDMVQSAENLEVIKKAAADLAGHPVHLTVRVVEGNARPEQPEQNAPRESPSEQLIDRMKNETVVKAYLDAFQGEITQVKKIDGQEREE